MRMLPFAAAAALGALALPAGAAEAQTHVWVGAHWGAPPHVVQHHWYGGRSGHWRDPRWRPPPPRWHAPPPRWHHPPPRWHHPPPRRGWYSPPACRSWWWDGWGWRCRW